MKLHTMLLLVTLTLSLSLQLFADSLTGPTFTVTYEAGQVGFIDFTSTDDSSSSKVDAVAINQNDTEKHDLYVWECCNLGSGSIDLGIKFEAMVNTNDATKIINYHWSAVPAVSSDFMKFNGANGFVGHTTASNNVVDQTKKTGETGGDDSLYQASITLANDMKSTIVNGQEELKYNPLNLFHVQLWVTKEQWKAVSAAGTYKGLITVTMKAV